MDEPIRRNRKSFKSLRPCLWFLLLSILGSCSREVSPPDPSDGQIPEWQASLDEAFDSQDLYQENIHLFEYDRQLPLEIVEVRSWQQNEVTFTDITFASPKGGSIPATLIQPPGPGPFAGVVMQHGMPSNRQSQFMIGKIYADMGAVVILIDAPFARPQNEGRRPLSLTQQDRAEHIQLIVDLRRAIDLLAARQDVDANRLAYVGISYGGMVGGLLAGIENRLLAYVLVVGDGGLVNHLMIDREGQANALAEMAEAERNLWIETMWPIESIHYVSHATPAALLFQHATNDPFVPADLALSFQKAGSAPKTIKWYDSGHRLPFEHVLDQLEWLSPYIGIKDVRSLPRVNLYLMDPVEDFILFNPQLRNLAILIDRVLVVWLALLTASILFLLWHFRGGIPSPIGAKFNCFLTVLFFGPFGLLAYHFSHRQATAPKSTLLPIRIRAIGSTLWSVSGHLVGVIAAIGILEAPTGISNSLPLVVLIVLGLPLFTGWAFNRLAQFGSRHNLKGQWSSRHSFLANLVSTIIVIVIAVPMFVFFIVNWLYPWYPAPGWDLSSPPFWAAASIVACVAAIFAYPAHMWMMRHKMLEWGPSSTAEDRQ